MYVDGDADAGWIFLFFLEGSCVECQAARGKYKYTPFPTNRSSTSVIPTSNLRMVRVTASSIFIASLLPSLAAWGSIIPRAPEVFDYVIVGGEFHLWILPNLLSSVNFARPSF